MKPQENLQSNETIPEISPDVAYTIDLGKPDNGVYKNADEAAAWRDYYRVDTAPSLNTVSLESPTNYPVASVENVAENTIEVETESLPDNTEVGELTEVTAVNPERSTEVTLPTTEVMTDDVIDVDAREVSVDLESLDDETDIGKLIADNEEITVGKEKLALTPHFKKVAEDALAFMEGILSTSDPELPPEIDWRDTIKYVAEDYNDSYDYGALYDLLNTQYRRRNAKMRKVSGFSTSNESLANRPITSTLEGGGPPGEQPPNASTEATPEATDPAAGENLKIEMDHPEVAEDMPQIGYEGTTPALTYEPNTADQSPGQSSAQPQITQK